ncbi:MAG: DUF2892 domain-containing protein [Anaerolineaceae bacterium]|nr:DUF2892 domain-containing protein [Anaerolineaceae bacterium]
MDKTEFLKRLEESPRPVMVDLWAAWCGPCRAMEPAFKVAEEKYAGQVDVWKINADESPEVLKHLRVMGIPTVVGFSGGKEIIRRTGVQSVEALDILFQATLNGQSSVIVPPAPIDRLIRAGGGLALLLMGWTSGRSILLMAAGAVLLFSAFYDRCPVYRAIAPRIAEFFQRSK